jgi:hypothetical protein
LGAQSNAAEIDFGRFAAQCRRPIGLTYINCASGIPAQLRREAEEQEFLFTALRRLRA